MAGAAPAREFVSADSLLRDSLALGMQIVRSGFRPTFLVGVWRGGAPIGIAVQEVVEFHGIECDHLAVRTSSYTAPEAPIPAPRCCGRNRRCHR